MSLYAYQDAELLNYHIQCNYNRRRLFTAYEDALAGRIEILSAVWIQSHDSSKNESPFEYPLKPLFRNRYKHRKRSEQLTQSVTRSIFHKGCIRIKINQATDEKILLPKVMSVAVLQNALQWLQLDNLDIKYTATRILLMLSQDKENEAIVNQRVISLIDNENVYLKNLILRRIFKTKGIYESTKRYAISKCQQDPCSVVRMVCKEVQSTEEE